MVFSQVRGVDSTGIASVSRNEINKYRDIKLAKEVGPPYYLWDTKSFDKVFYGTNQLYMGHNRSRTVGEANRKNAHPFLFDNILGAHNGTLDMMNKNRLEKGSDFRTDSEAIFNNIEVHGIQDTIGRIEKHGAAYALTWYDREDNSINFIRNEERPLWYVYANERRTLFWASECEILLAACHRQQMKLDEKAYISVVDTHLKWIIPSNEHDKLSDPIRAKYENKVLYAAHGVRSGFFPGMGGRSSNTKFDETPWANDPNNPEFVDPVIACSLPQDRVSYLDKISAGIQSLRDKSVILNTEEIKPTVMSPDDFTRRRKFEEGKGVLLEKAPAKLPLQHKNSDIQIYRDSDTGQWLTLRWNPVAVDWERKFSDIAPPELPFTILHINSHCFDHQGKKGKKRVYYKGFKKDLLTQETFNNIMKNGCLNCDRHPEWGHEVAFLDHEHHFVCEHCMRTPRLIDDLRQQCKKAEVG